MLFDIWKSSTMWVAAVIWCLLGLAAAQSVAPSNGTVDLRPSDLNDQFVVEVTNHNNFGISTLQPLTNSLPRLTPSLGVSGHLKPVALGTAGDLSRTDIAWISCDDSAYPDGYLQGPLETLIQAINSNAAAVIFHSESSTWCNYTAGGNVPSQYTNIFSMVDKTNSTWYTNNLGDLWNRTDSGGVNATISLRSEVMNTTRNSNGTAPGSTSQGPSTATAMIILYSITGVITALFLIIIITGAVRAHRHPERYGPRAVLGRARQSRAKGLARAMLDSIPIVKFGDTEEGAAKPGDVEMTPGSSSDPQAAGTAAATGSAEGAEQAEKSDRAVPETTEVGDASAASASSAAAAGAAGAHAHDHDHDHRHSHESEDGIQGDAAPACPRPAATNDDSLGCSICTEDFERGEDVRVLPCNHKFHPACIDPWLLNVSGTCPLCRIDLRPPTVEKQYEFNDPSSPEAVATRAAVAAGGAESSTPEARRQSRRRSLFLDPLNRRRMQDATPAERIEALREYNERTGGTGAEASRRRKLSHKVDAVLGRIRRHGDASEDASRSATPALPAPVVETNAAAGPSSAAAPAPAAREVNTAAGPSSLPAISPVSPITTDGPVSPIAAADAAASSSSDPVSPQAGPTTPPPPSETTEPDVFHTPGSS